jgi:Exportin-5 family
LEQLAVRGKLTYSQWLQWIRDLPQAVQNANQQQIVLETEYIQVEEALTLGLPPGQVNVPDTWSRQANYHRALSRMLAAVVSSHISLVVQDKNLLKGMVDNGNSNQNAVTFSNYLTLMVEILGHPSGRVVGEQITLWATLLRDPQISKSTRLLDPLSADILTAFINHTVRIEWEDGEDESHPQIALLQATWEDEEDYNLWANDFRSRSSQVFKFNLICLQWCSLLRAQTQASLLELAHCILAWNPTDLWLERKCQYLKQQKLDILIQMWRPE